MAFVVNGVSIWPGLIRVSDTGAFSSSSSMRRDSVKPLMECLDAQYIPCSGTARSDTSLPRLINAPPCAFKCGSAASEPCTTPQKFTSNNCLLSASAFSSSRPYIPVPASLTQVSKPP